MKYLYILIFLLFFIYLLEYEMKGNGFTIGGDFFPRITARQIGSNNKVPNNVLIDSNDEPIKDNYGPLSYFIYNDCSNDYTKHFNDNGIKTCEQYRYNNESDDQVTHNYVSGFNCHELYGYKQNKHGGQDINDEQLYQCKTPIHYNKHPEDALNIQKTDPSVRNFYGPKGPCVTDTDKKCSDPSDWSCNSDRIPLLANRVTNNCKEYSSPNELPKLPFTCKINNIHENKDCKKTLQKYINNCSNVSDQKTTNKKYQNIIDYLKYICEINIDRENKYNKENLMNVNEIIYDPNYGISDMLTEQALNKWNEKFDENDIISNSI